MMDHEEAVRQKATEKYLLGELDPGLRDQFEEHLFECQDCAMDVRAAAMFVEQAKAVLAETPATSAIRAAADAQRSDAQRPDTQRSDTRKSDPSLAQGWFSWLRPALAVPALALLLAVIGYQNFVTFPHLLQAANEPRIGPWASLNISTRGSEPILLKMQAGEGFNLLINLPPDQSYSAYTLQLYNPEGKLQWTGRIPAALPDIPRSIYVPGAGLEQGNYKLTIHGVTAAGESSEISSHAIEVQIQR
jgi:hypothetical protein